MVPHTRYRLRKAWGFCERHAWGAVLVEASFRHGYMHGPAILYEDLLEPAVRAANFWGPLKSWRLLKSLRNKGPCMMCEMNLGPEKRGAATADLVERGRGPGKLQASPRAPNPTGGRLSVADVWEMGPGRVAGAISWKMPPKGR